MINVQKGRIIVETTTLRAVIERGAITALQSKLDKKQYLRADRSSVPLELVYIGQEVVPLGSEPGEGITNLRVDDRRAEVRIEAWNGDGVIAIGEDPLTGDLLVEPGGYASRPGLRACRYSLAGIAPELELIAPFWQGVRLSLDDPLVRGSFWDWPRSWEAGMVILQGKGGGLWVHCRDDRYRYKNLLVGGRDDPYRLGFETEAYGPLSENLSAGGLTWRINVYEGGWQKPAGAYRRWLGQAYGLDASARPGWLKDLRLALGWCPCEGALLHALAKRVAPRRVLLHVPRWRTDGYDQNYPTFKASRTGRAFLRKAQEMGFHVMPHCNAIDMDPTHPLYACVRDFQYRDADTRQIKGWSWHEGKAGPPPESNAARMRYQDRKVMVKIHPGLSMWRSILREEVRSAVESLDLDCVFLDVTMNTWNLHRCLVEGMTPSEGMKRLIADVGTIREGLMVGGEGRNEIVMQDQHIAQVHLFRSSGRVNVEGLERTGRCPLCEFLFGRWCRSFGYSNLSGATPDQELRLRLHASLGAVPTLTVRSAQELVRPKPAVEAILAQAGK
jgi:hypothetical protein